MTNTKEIRVERVETFACEGAKGTASQRPRILLQILNNGTAAAKCPFRERTTYLRNEVARESVYYCTADPVNPEQKISISQAIDASIARHGDSTDPEELKKSLKTLMGRYYLECPFQSEMVAP